MRAERKQLPRWNLLSESQPTVPGDYWVSILEYPYEGAQGHMHHGCVVRMDSSDIIKQHIRFHDEFPPETICWHGPIQHPQVPVRRLKQLRKSQAQAFVQTHRKVCEKCWAVTRVNQRSIGYFGQMSDCAKCFAKNSVQILELSALSGRKNPSPTGTSTLNPPVAPTPLSNCGSET
jgi:hypothetical protein